MYSLYSVSFIHSIYTFAEEGKRLRELDNIYEEREGRFHLLQEEIIREQREQEQLLRQMRKQQHS